MIYITRREHFSAAHRLFRPEWTEEQNNDRFGKCANPNWHGHNYTLYVTVKGEIDPVTGYCADLKEISTLTKKYVIDKVDHRNFNMDVDFMKDKMASTEIIAMEMWNQLEPHINKLGACKLHCIKLVETENNFVEYFGGK